MNNEINIVPELLVPAGDFDWLPFWSDDRLSDLDSVDGGRHAAASRPSPADHQALPDDRARQGKNRSRLG